MIDLTLHFTRAPVPGTVSRVNFRMNEAGRGLIIDTELRATIRVNHSRGTFFLKSLKAAEVINLWHAVSDSLTHAV